MAVSIKDGNGGTDQAGVLPVAKSLKVTLVDTLGNVNSVPLATSTTGALELNGNLAALRADSDQVLTQVLALILKELTIQTEILTNGFNLGYENYARYRDDPDYIRLDVPNR